MISKYRQACISVLLLCALATAHAGVHKWVDANGVTHYSEEAPAGQASTEVQTAAPPPNAPAGESTLDVMNKADAMVAERKRRIAAEQQAEQEQKLQANQQKMRCAVARRNLEVLQSRARVYTFGEEGQKVYMDDAARARELESAQKAVSEYCQ